MCVILREDTTQTTHFNLPHHTSLCCTKDGVNTSNMEENSMVHKSQRGRVVNQIDYKKLADAEEDMDWDAKCGRSKC